MKLLILVLVSLAVVACGVPQEEHDEVSNRLSQTETKLDAVSRELKTVSSELEANNKLVDGLKERISSIPQKSPIFSSGEASALVRNKIMDDITLLGFGTRNWPDQSRFIQGDHSRESRHLLGREDMCVPLVSLVDWAWASWHYHYSTPLIPKLTEIYTDQGHWLVGLTWPDIIGPDNIFNDEPYQWKVYELSGAVERIGVDRTYC